MMVAGYWSLFDHIRYLLLDSKLLFATRMEIPLAARLLWFHWIQIIPNLRIRKKVSTLISSNQ
jgi:hypothetical protein